MGGLERTSSPEEALVTLRPIDSFVGVRGVEGPRYKVGPRCANPTCRRLAHDAHHIWSRGKQSGDYAWIELPDGTILGNLTALCVECHRDITGGIGGYKAAIRMDVRDYRLWWCKTVGENGAMNYEPIDLIVPQPPTRESLIAAPADRESENSCPTCGQPRPRRRSPSIPASGEGRRRRKSWTIQVPDDEEDGALVLDTLVDDLAPQFDIERIDAKSRYFVVVPALVFAHQERERFAESILGKGA